LDERKFQATRFASLRSGLSGRDAFQASTPCRRSQSSTGGKPRLGRITKMGDRYLRKLLVVGACATLRHRKGHNDALRLWASGVLERKMVKYKFKLTAVALANKVAHRLRADDEGRPIRPSDRGLTTAQASARGVFAAKAISIEGADEVM
jgi:hypothetical protein